MERTGVPAFSTRASAKAIIKRWATGSMAKIAARPVAGAKADRHRAGDRRFARGIEDDDRGAGLDCGSRHGGHETGRRVIAAKQHDTDLRPQHLHRSMAQLAAFEREAGTTGQFGQSERQRLGDTLQPAAGRDDGRDIFESGERGGDVMVCRRLESGNRGVWVVAEGGEDCQMQGEGHRQAAGRGEGKLGAAGADQ